MQNVEMAGPQRKKKLVPLEKNRKETLESQKQDMFISGTGFYSLSILDCDHLSVRLFC